MSPDPRQSRRLYTVIPPRYSDQTKGEWVGHIIASVIGFDVSNQRKLTNRIRVNVQSLDNKQSAFWTSLADLRHVYRAKFVDFVRKC
jgi:hypothetical protein